jgi:Anti-sigma factor NepR
VPQARSPIVERIKSALHAQYDAILNEPLPERWVDLIHRLNEQERRQRESEKRKQPYTPSRSS